MVELADTRDLKSLAYSVPVRVRVSLLAYGETKIMWITEDETVLQFHGKYINKAGNDDEPMLDYFYNNNTRTSNQIVSLYVGRFYNEW